MTYRLYFAPGGVSFSSHVLARELGIECELERIDLNRGEQLAPSFVAVNAEGKVPVLETPGGRLTETVAILLYLLDVHGPGSWLAPRGAVARYEALRWLAWLASEVHPVFRAIWFPERSVADARCEAAVRRAALDTFTRKLDAANEAARGAWMGGSAPNVVDLHLMAFFRFGNRVGLPMRSRYPRWAQRAEELARRPAVAAAYRFEGVALWDPCVLKPIEEVQER